MLFNQPRQQIYYLHTKHSLKSKKHQKTEQIPKPKQTTESFFQSESDKKYGMIIGKSYKKISQLKYLQQQKSIHFKKSNPKLTFDKLQQILNSSLPKILSYQHSITQNSSFLLQKHQQMYRKLSIHKFPNHHKNSFVKLSLNKQLKQCLFNLKKTKNIKSKSKYQIQTQHSENFNTSNTEDINPSSIKYQFFPKKQHQFHQFRHSKVFKTEKQ